MFHELIERHPRTIVVGASRYAADDLVRQACQHSLIGIGRYSFRELVHALAAEPANRRGVTPLSTIGCQAICASISGRSNLRYLDNVKRFPGFPSALHRTLLDLRLAKASRSALRNCGRSGRDLAELLTAYEEQLDERGVGDYQTLIDLAVAGSRESDPYALIGIGVDLPTVAERDLWAVVVANAAEYLDLAVEPHRSPPKTCLEAVQRFTLNGTPAPQRHADVSFRYVSASSEALEFAEIARDILEGSIPLDQSAVLLRDPRRQEPLVRETFDRVGIPAWYSHGSRRTDLAGRAFLAILRFAQEYYSAKIFCEYLALKRSPVAPNVRWERIIREAAVIRGHERWYSRLNAKADSLTREGASASKDLRALNELRDFALPIIDALVRLPRRADWSAWFDALSTLAEQTLGVPDSILEVLDELAPLGDLGPVNLSDVLSLLSRTIPDRLTPESGSRYGRVFVGSIAEAAEMRFEKVFVPGMNEGSFPRLPQEDSLLLDEQRRALGMHLAPEDGDLLRIAIMAASKNIVFSNSRIDVATGRARVPSSYVAEVLLAARGAGADLRTLFDEARLEQTRIGWSAPNETEHCIDDIEYDLSSYRQAMRTKTPGSYSWIGKLNPHTRRAIEARTRKWEASWGEWDGMIATSDLLGHSLLAAYGLKEKAYSVSALQLFSRCPYLFYLSAITRLAPLEEPEALDRMSALSRGRIFHKVVFRSFNETKAIPTLDELRATVRSAADEEAELCAPLIPAFWQADVAKLQSDLAGWFATRDPNWAPIYAEFGFGLDHLDDRAAASVADPAELPGGFRVKGSIDLVERKNDGRLRVVDHKTGKFPYELKNPVIHGGEILQPVIYAQSLEAVTGEPVNEALLSFGTVKGGYRGITIRIDEEAKLRARQVLSVADKMVAQAFLPAAPRGDACKTCDYRVVCGPYEDKRVVQKSDAELQPLTHLRSLR